MCESAQIVCADGETVRAKSQFATPGRRLNNFQEKIRMNIRSTGPARFEFSARVDHEPNTEEQRPFFKKKPVALFETPPA